MLTVIYLIKLNSVVIVEGKYDKITLQNIIDATIVTTNGFGIYKDRKKKELIKLLCEKNGAVIITDSDNAGAQIRSYIKSFCNTQKIVNVYLPQILGKEKRKTQPSKQGLLGLEGMDKETVLKALERSGVLTEEIGKSEKITKSDLYTAGLSGGGNSKNLRNDFSSFVELPKALSANAFLDALNSIFTREEFLSEVRKWRQVQAKN